MYQLNDNTVDCTCDEAECWLLCLFQMLETKWKQKDNEDNGMREGLVWHSVVLFSLEWHHTPALSC